MGINSLPCGWGQRKRAGRFCGGTARPFHPQGRNYARMSTNCGHTCLFPNGKYSGPRIADTCVSSRTGNTGQVRIYRCCQNCGKGDTPLSKRLYCEVCGERLSTLCPNSIDNTRVGPLSGDLNVETNG
jgi:hypothetical protein